MALRRRGWCTRVGQTTALKRHLVAAFWLLTQAAPPAWAELQESIRTRHYTADHRPGTTLLSSLNRHSPIRQDGQVFHAYTAWNIQWNFRWWEERDGRCRITSNRTSLQAEITLPQLNTGDPAVRRRFDLYLLALRAHEMEHVKIARDYGRRIDEGILRLPQMPSCTALTRAANGLGESLMREAAAAEREMDRQTNYGARQGATLLGD